MSVDTVFYIVLILTSLLFIMVLFLLIKLNHVASEIKYFHSRESESSNDVRQELSRAREQQLEKHAELQSNMERRLGEMIEHQANRFSQFSESLQNTLHQHRQGFEERQMETLKIQMENLNQGMSNVQQQVTEALTRYGDDFGKRMEALSQTTDQRLKDISGQVEKRLSEGFEKTTATFTDVLKRLALIDEAQKKIAELSGNVVSLQEVLADKRSRGAFGEVQLNALVRNVMPESSFKFQYMLPNDTRVDCMLFLPEPTGNIAIDSKFPLESYRLMTDISASDSQRQMAERQFKQDIRKHIKDIADKYIIPGSTSDGAVMFIPAEAVFAEIHAHFYDLVEEAQRAKVWLVSPTTLMAVLTTARAVLKDSATRRQVHIIQDHLIALSRDFDRFKIRMSNLSKHINQAQKDVEDVSTSARKISSRFEKIEKVEILEEESAILLEGPHSDEMDNNNDA